MLGVIEDHRLKVLENKVLRRTFAPKRDNIPAELQHNEELHNCYILLIVLREIKSRRLRCGWH
jgi:hypothetical protein